MKFGKQHIHSLPINDITTMGALAQQLQREAEARGEELPPPIRLHIGEPSFRTPEHIRMAAAESVLNEQQGYSYPAGLLWLRELLAEKVKRVNGYHVGPEHCAIALGGTGAIMVTLLATVGPGDEVLIPDPGWPQYRMHLATCGATAVPYPLDPQNEWVPDIAKLEQLVTPRTRVLIINTPGNPTGAVFSEALVGELLEFARLHDLYLLSDECYDEIVFEGKHISPAALLSPEEFESGRVICVYTFSKTYAMTGWRIGYAVTGSKLMQTIISVLDASYTNISPLIQKAAATALTGPQDCVAEMRTVYQQRRDLAIGLLKDLGRYVYTPHGAFYTMVDVSSRHGIERKGKQFATDLLLERNITVAPGSTFGAVSEQFVRVSLAASDAEIEQGVREICLFADR